MISINQSTQETTLTSASDSATNTATSSGAGEESMEQSSVSQIQPIVWDQGEIWVVYFLHIVDFLGLLLTTPTQVRTHLVAACYMQGRV